MRRVVVTALVGLLTWSCNQGDQQAAAPPSLPLHVRAQRPDSVVAMSFLGTLKAGFDTSNGGLYGFDVTRGGHWSVDSVAAFVGPSGLHFFDVNGDSSWSESRASLRSALRRKQGHSYQALVHLGYIASQRYDQYSSVTFSRAGDSLVVLVGDEMYRVVTVSGYIVEVRYLREEHE